MKNASSVFGDYVQLTESNTVHLEKPHYYPSHTKELDANSKKIGLHQKYLDPPTQDEETSITSGKYRNVVGEVVPESFESLISFIGDSSGSSKYNESWPATEPSYTSKIPDESTINVTEVNNKEHSIEDYLEKHGENEESRGTLLKFVQRFREQPPLSRSQRYLQKEKQPEEEFWWLSSQPLMTSSTPKSTDSSALSSKLNSISFSPTISDSPSSISACSNNRRNSTVPSREDSDSATARIQLRTEKLLQLSENATSSATVKSNHSLPSKYKEIVHATIGDMNRFARPSNRSSYNSYGSEGVTVDLPKSLKPEDDILYKWRLSRKMEQAAKTASSITTPFLNFSKAKEYISKEKQELSIDQHPDVVKKSKECLYADEVTASKKRIDSTEIFANNNTSNENVPDSTVKSNHACCKRETIQGCRTQTCSEGKEDLSKSSSIGHHRAGSPAPDVTCACCKRLDDERIYCNCRKLSHLCHMYAYNIPPHAHNACDISPCVHQQHFTSNTVKSQQTNDQIVMDGKNMSDQTKATNQQRGDVTEKKRPEDATISSKNNISPVINQVINAHLFEENSRISNMSASDNSTEINVEPTHRGNENTDLNRPLEDSSSEDEFPSDEILRELRSRRKNNEDDLMFIRQKLRRLQEQRTKGL